jgi:glutamyl-tRNA reductase
MSDEGRQAVERMTQALINKILHDPTEVLKRNGCQGGRSAYLDITRKLFKLDE